MLSRLLDPSESGMCVACTSAAVVTPLLCWPVNVVPPSDRAPMAVPTLWNFQWKYLDL
jgi:hypothetical protein